MKHTYLISTLLLSGSLATGLNAASILHSFDFNDAPGTPLQSAANTGTVGGAFGAFTVATSAVTTGAGVLSLTHNGADTRSRLDTGLDLPTSMPLHQTVSIAGWNMNGAGSYVRIYFMNAPQSSTSLQITTELRFNVNAAGDGVDFVVGTGGTGSSALVPVASYGLVQTESLTFRTEFDWSTATASFSQLQADDTWLPLASDLTVGTTGNPAVVRDAISSQFRMNGTVSMDINSFSVTAIPEPRTYAVIAGLVVLAGAVYRRRRAN